MLQYFPDKLANSPSQLFVTFSTDTKQFYSGRAATSSKNAVKVKYEDITGLKGLMNQAENIIVEWKSKPIKKCGT